VARTKEERLALVHQDAMREFEKIQTANRDERLQCLQDRRFYSIAGAQWEGPLGIQFENKPRLEVNKIHLAVMRIINEYRNNRITVTFHSKDGENADNIAEACASMYRATEQDSMAEEAYDNAFEEAVGGGFGAWRLRAEYEDESDEDDDRQRICIEPIFDADSCVFFDLNAKRQDKADAKHCYVLTSMTYDAYRDEWGDDPTSWPKQIHQRMFDWLTPDVVYVAEYYAIEEKAEMVYFWRSLTGEEKKVRESEYQNDPELEDQLKATGWQLARQKKVKRKRCHKYIMSGAKILEDCGLIAGSCIPIIPVYGKRWFVDNVERCMGHVRLAKDPQRLKNMQLSKLAEISAYSSVRKPIFTPEQVAGHQVMWSEDNLKNYPYLLINQLTDQSGNPQAIGPASYVESPDIPPAMGALLQLTEQDMTDVLGNQQAADQMVSNISGKAVEMIQTRLDMQSFIYMSNMAKAVKRCGEVWLSMARDVFVESGRKMKGIGNQGQIESIELAKPVMNEKGEIEYENDLAGADLDVAVDVGPSSASKRQSTVQALTGMMQITQDPETLQVLSAMAMMNMDGEGISDVRDYFRKRLIRMGVVKPTDEEQQELMAEMQNQQPDAQTQYFQAAASQANAAAAKAKADTILSVAKAKETEAKIIETLSNIDISQRDNILKSVQAIVESGISGGGMPQPDQQAINTASAQPSSMGEQAMGS
jgi:hypothetical protein